MKSAKILLVVACATLISSCGPAPSGDNSGASGAGSAIESHGGSDSIHTHTYSDEYSYDEEYHWRVATCEHSDLVTDLAEHDMHESEDGTFKQCSVCGYKVDLDDSLATPTNFAFANGILSFDPVEHATIYDVTVSKGNDIIFNESSSKTAYNLGELEAGKYDVTVIAKNGSLSSKPGTYSFVIEDEIDTGLYLDADLILEAENAILNSKHFSYDSAAHGGAYALAIDDNGQGLYFRYYAFEAGNRDVTITYSTAMENSYHYLIVNGNRFKVTYGENTGWFGDTQTSANVVVPDVTFVQGWNELYLAKDGKSDDSPAWGGYAQIDYITIEGTNNEYRLEEFDLTNHSYHFEAEMAQWHWNNENQKPTNWGSPFSMGYGLGEMNKDGDGVKFNFTIKDAGSYAIRPVLGGNKSLKVSVDGGTPKVYEFGEFTQWNNPVVSGDSICVLELSEGVHSLDFTRNDNWFTFDKLVIERVEQTI